MTRKRRLEEERPGTSVVSALRRGPTYFIRYGIEKPDGTLWGLAGSPDGSGEGPFPKLYVDPSSCPRFIKALYDLGKWDPKKQGELKIVRVCLFRVDDREDGPTQDRLPAPRVKQIAARPKRKKAKRR